MPQPPEGYVTDVAYTPLFHREQAPVWLAATLNALGYAAPALSGSRFLDLGCGSGLSLLLFAAANPDMRFTGVDLNAAHIAAAKALAEAAGLANAEFHHAAIGDFAAGREGESFDFIVSHGVYAWVSPEVRRDIRDAIGRLLKKGGVAYLHYMTQPGAAPFAAFHTVFRQMAAAGRTPEQAVDAGLALLSALREASAGFFVAHPTARDTLAQLAKEEWAYVAHEYLGGNFAPLHVADVMADMGEAGLRHVGSATPVENIDALSIPGSVLPVVQREKDPALRETLKDIARNQALRRDLYMREPQALDARAHMAALRSRVFSSLPGAPASGPLVFDTRIGPVQGSSELVSPVLARLAQGPASFAELESVGGFSTRPGLLNQALHVMMGAGVVHPLLAGTGNAAAERLNAVLLERLRSGSAVPALASPEIGSALPL